jgi:hypothetical protein
MELFSFFEEESPEQEFVLLFRYSAGCNISGVVTRWRGKRFPGQEIAYTVFFHTDNCTT